jgi:predicted RNA-binding protein with RPS1 domain
MRAYEVFLNGKKLCVAGIASDGYISAYITYVSEGNKTWIDVTGLDNRKKRYVQWARTKLRTGDEVSLKVVDRKSVDKYKTIRRHDEKRDIESTKRETRRNAKAFGWEIVEKRKVK